MPLLYSLDLVTVYSDCSGLKECQLKDIYDIDNKITMIREVKEGGRESSPLVQAMGLVNLFEKYYGNMQDLGLYNIFDEVEANSA